MCRCRLPAKDFWSPVRTQQEIVGVFSMLRNTSSNSCIRSEFKELSASGRFNCNSATFPYIDCFKKVGLFAEKYRRYGRNNI